MFPEVALSEGWPVSTDVLPLGCLIHLHVTYLTVSVQPTDLGLSSEVAYRLFGAVLTSNSRG